MSQEFTDSLLQDLAFLKEVTEGFQNDPPCHNMLKSLLDRARRLLMNEMEYNRNLLDLKVLILGEFNSGKSSFMNTLLGEDLCPTGIKPTTSVTFAGSADSFKLTKPNPLLKGISLVDTPGLSNPLLQHLEDTWLTSELLESDVVFLVANANDKTGLKHSLNTMFKRRSTVPRLRWYLVLSWSDLLSSSQLNALKEEISRSFPDWFDQILFHTARLHPNQEMQNELLYALFRKFSMERLEILRSKRQRAQAEYRALRTSTFKEALNSLKAQKELEKNRRFVRQYIASLQLTVSEYFKQTSTDTGLCRSLFREHIGKELKKVNRELEADPCFLSLLQNRLSKLQTNSRILQILFSDTLQSRDSALRNKVSRINAILNQELPLRRQLGSEQIKNLTAEQMRRFLVQTVMEILSAEMAYCLGVWSGQNEWNKNAAFRIRSFLGEQACA